MRETCNHGLEVAWSLVEQCWVHVNSSTQCRYPETHIDQC